jgi:hypothetical protein
LRILNIDKEGSLDVHHPTLTKCLRLPYLAIAATIVVFGLGAHAQSETQAATAPSTATPSAETPAVNDAADDAGVSADTKAGAASSDDTDTNTSTTNADETPAAADAGAASADVPNPPAPLDAAAEAAAAASPDVAPETQVEPATAPLPNSKGLEESSLSNDKGHDDFKRPLLFAPEDNGLQPDNPQIKWELDASGKKINMGGLKLGSSQISLKIDQTKRASAPDDIRSNEKGLKSVINFSFWWPTLLTKDGTVTIETMNKKVIWSQPVTEDSRAEWRKKLARYKTSFLKRHQGSTWGFTDLPAKALHPFRAGSPFLVCISKQTSAIEKLRVCSAPHAFQKIGHGRTIVGPLKRSETATVFLKDKPIGKTGLINAPLGKELALKVQFSDGPTIEIASQPHPLDLLDVVESKDGREIILTGRNSLPLGKKKIIERPAMHFWSPSGIEQDTVWQMALPKDEPTIRILGAFNLPFTFLFRFNKLPTENDRVFIKEQSSTGTYSKEPVLFGYTPKTGPVRSTENSAEKTDEHHFEWDFAAPQIGARNTARITLLGDQKAPTKWVAHHTLYRGYPFEASARLTGVLGSGGQLIVLGEIAGSAWLETIGFQNELISRQRWGVAARYFRAITAIESTGGQSVSDFSAVNADLKYNLVRGIWNRDQLFGLIGSVQHVGIAGLSANMIGIGGYWARTMPKLFADLFEKFPLLDYSKYVDVEFVYYPVSTEGGITTSTSYNLNFHGKVFWTSRVYGEAGFGIRQYGFADPSQNAKIEFATAYGNIGMGIIF